MELIVYAFGYMCTVQQQRFQAGAEAEFLLNDEDVEFVVQQVWNSRCAITHRRFGGHIMLTLTRWHADEPASAYNLVLIMQNEAAKLAEKEAKKAEKAAKKAVRPAKPGKAKKPRLKVVEVA